MYEIWPNARSENKREKSKRSIFLLYTDSRREKVACIVPTDRAGCFSRCSPLLQPPWLLSCALVLAFIRRHPEEKDDARAHTHTQYTQKETKKRWTLSYLFRRRNTQTAAVCPCRQQKKRRDCLAWLGLLRISLFSPWAPFFTSASPWYRKEIEKDKKK